MTETTAPRKYCAFAERVFPGATVHGFVVESVRFVTTTHTTYAHITTPLGSEVEIEVIFS